MPTLISYFSDGTKYTPDFYLEDQNLYIEIKGYDYENLGVERAKKFQEQYPEFSYSFLRKKDLENNYKLDLSKKYIDNILEEMT